MTQDNLHEKLLDHLKTGVLLLDKDLRPLLLNLAAESLVEISTNQAAKLTLRDILGISHDEIDEIKSSLHKQTSYTKHEVKLNLLLGKSIIVDYTVIPLYQDGEQQIMMEINAIHYSQRFSRDEALLSSQATTRELVRGLAHEIKNPLGGIRGAAQLLVLELPDSALTDYTNVIIEEADRLRNLVDRLVGSKQPPKLRPLNIHEVLERVTNLTEAEVTDRTIAIEKDYDPSIPLIIGDPEQLIQAVLNIVRNAVQALDSPDVNHDLGKIVLRTRVVRNTTIGNTLHRLAVKVVISDNGPGVPEHIADTLFFPMISGRADGTGLGLSITQSIINHHGGIIECDSKPGSTAFSFTIPINDAPQGNRGNS